MAIINETLWLRLRKYHDHTYKFCMEYCLQVNYYKRGDAAYFQVMSDKFNALI
jgi:hypothetical protein